MTHLLSLSRGRRSPASQTGARTGARTGALLLTAALLASTASPSRAGDLSFPVAERQLENGLKVLVLEDTSIPNAALYVGWRVGSRNERPGITGLAHFFEHMMFSSGERYGGRFDPLMEAQGGANNAYTSRDVTVYQDWFPAPRLPLILDMEADRMRALKLRPELVASERGVVASERRLAMEDPAGVCEEQLWAAAYTAHPYQWDVLGWMVDIENWAQEDLEAFFRAHYAPNNAVLVVVGAVSADDVFRRVERLFGAIPRAPARRPIHTQEPPQRGERRVEVEAHAGIARLLVGWHVPETAAPATPALEVLERVLLGGESSRLQVALVDHELALEVAGGVQGPAFDPTLFMISVTLREGVAPSEAEGVLDEELTRLIEEGPTPAELETAKNALAADLVRRARTNDGKAGLLTDAELFWGGWRQLSERPRALAAVTAKAVQAVARRYLVRRNRTVVTLAPGAALDEQEGATAAPADAPDDAPAVSGGVEGGDAASPAAPDSAPEVAPVARAASQLTGPEEPELGPLALSLQLPTTRALTLENGLRVLLLPDPEVPLVTYLARVEGGARQDADGKEGTAALLATLLSKGAGERDGRAFREAVERVGGALTATATPGWVEVEAEFLARDRDLGLELLADVLRRPLLDADELTRQQQQAADALTAARDDPHDLISVYWNAWVLRGHPDARPLDGDEASLARIERADVLAARAAMRPERTWLAVAGDFDADAMLTALRTRFGDWKRAPSGDEESAERPTPPAARRKPPVERPAPFAPPSAPSALPRSAVLLVNDPDALQTYFTFGNVAFEERDPDHPARLVANTILGGRFTSRLNTALRIESGLTYGARSQLDDVRGGLLAVGSYTATATSREALELAHTVYQRFVRQGITQDELESARTYIKGQFAPDHLETPAQAAATLLDLRMRGLPREHVEGLFARLDALEVEGVNGVITKRLPKEALGWVVIGRASVLREVVAQFGPVTEIELSAPGFGD